MLRCVIPSHSVSENCNLVLSTTGASTAPEFKTGATMKIRIRRDTVCGGERVKTGDVVDASSSDARYLIVRGKAEEYKMAKKPRASKKDV